LVQKIKVQYENSSTNKLSVTQKETCYQFTVLIKTVETVNKLDCSLTHDLSRGLIV